MIPLSHEAIKNKAHFYLKAYHLESPPVPIENIIKEEGIRIIYSDDLPDNLDDSYLIKIKSRYTIIINNKSDNYSKRYWLAYHFGHIVLHSKIKTDTLQKDYLSEKERSIINREADLFASEILAPSVWLTSLDSCKLDDIEKIFEVPRYAINRFAQKSFSNKKAKNLASV